MNSANQKNSTNLRVLDFGLTNRYEELQGAEPTKTQECILFTTTTMITVTRLGVAHPSR